MPFEFKYLEIDGLVEISPKSIFDERGYFMETYTKEAFLAAGINEIFYQDNQSFSYKNVIRGLHYQIEPYQQGKLVRVASGSVWDVAVDIRRNSKTFGKWIGIKLTKENRKMLYIPPGFAHGFATLEDETVFIYKCTKEYNQESERGIVWNDRLLNIQWPIKKPIVSKKDALLPNIRNTEVFP